MSNNGAAVLVAANSDGVSEPFVLDRLGAAHGQYAVSAVAVNFSGGGTVTVTLEVVDGPQWATVAALPVLSAVGGTGGLFTAPTFASGALAGQARFRWVVTGRASALLVLAAVAA